MGDNIFDKVQQTAQNIVTKTMGYDATWTPSTGGSQQIARVLYNNPTAKYALDGEANYQPIKYMMEFFIRDFIGLKDSVARGNDEIVNINSIDYYVRDVTEKYDGKTFVSNLEPKV